MRKRAAVKRRNLVQSSLTLVTVIRPFGLRDERERCTVVVRKTSQPSCLAPTCMVVSACRGVLSVTWRVRLLYTARPYLLCCALW